MDLWANISLGFSQAISLQNLAYCFIGALYGTVIGVLPGIGPLVGISILLPITFSLPPVSAVVMLAGIYYGSAYGGSTTSILVNVPGESSSVVTCIDGYQMARRGRARRLCRRTPSARLAPPIGAPDRADRPLRLCLG